MLKRLAFTLLTLLALPYAGHAELQITVTEGTFRPIPIAISPFAGAGENSTVARNVTQVITDDLQSCGLFQIVNPAAYIQSTQEVMSNPRFEDWKVINTEALAGGLIHDNGGKLQVDFRLFDIFAAKQLEGKSMVTDHANWRRVAHQIADAIYEKMTGDKGYFDTRVVYIAESGSEMERKYRLAIMDQDGENHQYLSSGNTRVLTPRVSHDKTKVAYVDFGRNDKTPNLRLYNLTTGRSESLGVVHGQKMSPRFSPNDDHIILSSAKDGATSLYKMDLGTKQLQKVTNNTSTIDVSPCYSPDGSQIVYISDQGGKPQIYIKSTEGGDGTRISFGQGRYDNPIWSPRGDLIGFTRMRGGVFYIGVMRPDGSGERLLDSGYLLEGPTWSPNGREIMYTCQASAHGKSKICSVDIVGFNKRTVNIPGEGSYPTW